MGRLCRACGFLLLVVGCGSKTPPRNPSGVFDFRQTAVQKSAPLDGNWDFFPGEIGTKGSPISYVMPAAWNDATGLSSYGCGTLSARLLFRPEQHNLALRIPDIGTASRVVINGHVALDTGRIACSPDQMVPAVRPQIIGLPDASEISVQIQASNFMDRKGGPWSSVIIGTREGLEGDRTAAIFYDAILAGGTFLMGCYHLSLFAVRRKDRASLFFGIFCLLIGLRSTLTGERVLSLQWPGVPFELFFRIEYLTAYAAVPVFIHFFRETHPDRIRLWQVRSFDLVTGPFCIAVGIVPISVLTRTLPYYQGIILAGTAFVVFRTTKFAYEGDPEARMSLAGIFILSIAIVLDILQNEKVVHTRMFVPLGLFIFLLFQSLVHSFRFSKAFNASETYSRRLVELALHEKEMVQLLYEDRTRLYRDLHDGVASDLNGILIALRGMKKSGKDWPGDLLQIIERSAMRGLSEISDLINTDDEDSLTISYFVTWFQSMIREAAQAASIEVDLAFASNIDESSLGLFVAANLKKVCREIVKNLIMHSDASQLAAALRPENRGYVLTIADNGRPDADSLKKATMHLAAMEKRATECGLILQTSAASEQGTTIEIRIPERLVRRGNSEIPHSDDLSD